MKKENKGEWVLFWIVSLLGISPFLLIGFFFLALSGQLDKKTDRDVRKYLSEKYEISRPKLTYVEVSRLSAVDRCWRIEAKGDYPVFFVKQFGGGMDAPYLSDNLKDAELLEYYEKYEGSKETVYPEFSDGKRNETSRTVPEDTFYTTRIVIEFGSKEEYRQCFYETGAFSEYLTDQGLTSYDMRIRIRDGSGDKQIIYERDIPAKGEKTEELERQLIIYAVGNGLWSWLENIDEDRIEEVCREANYSGEHLSNVWENHKEDLKRKEEYRKQILPYHLASEGWDHLPKKDTTEKFFEHAEGAAAFFIWNTDSREALFSPGDELTLEGTAESTEAGIVFAFTESGSRYFFSRISDNTLRFEKNLSDSLPKDYHLADGTLFIKSEE